MKNMKRQIMALLLTGCMVITSSGIVASATEVTTPGSGETTVAAELVSPVYKLVVPTTYTFAVDAFEQTDAGSMIKSSEYTLINKSNVAVQVDVAMKIAAKDGVTLDIKETKAAVTDTDTTKKLWFAAVAPSSVTPETTEDVALLSGTDEVYSHTVDTVTTYNTTAVSGTAVTYTNTTGLTGTYGTFADLSDTSANVVTIGTTDATMTFALEKATGYTLDNETKLTGAIGAKGLTAFRFIGAVNSNAVWAAGDLSATVKYTFSGKSEANYTLLTDTTETDGYATIAGAYALVKKVSTTFAPAATPTAAVTPTPVPAKYLTFGTISSATGGTVTAAGTGFTTSETITSVTISNQDGSSPVILTPTAAYTWDASAKQLSLVSGKAWYSAVGTACKITIVFGSGTVTGDFTKE